MSTWRPCSSCKKPIEHGQRYWVCSVSTCNRARSPYVFCSTRCWDAHVPVLNHRSAWCEDRRAPRPGEDASDQPADRAPAAGVGGGSQARREAVASRRSDDGGVRRTIRPEPPPGETDILIVASRLKDYIARKADMRTSEDVLAALSDIVRYEADKAIEKAREDGRRTVKGRDFE